MNGTLNSKLGTLLWSINDKQVVVLKGKGLRYEGKGYDFTLRINPDQSKQFIALSCKFPETNDFRDMIMIVSHKAWDDYLVAHPSVKINLHREVKTKVAKLQIDQMREAVKRMSCQLEVLQAILTEIEL